MCNKKLPSNFSLQEYGRDLYSRRNEAIELGWADCGNDEWTPEEGKCHLNVTQLCANDLSLQPIRGWLYFDLPSLNRVRFVAHSVVRDSTGQYYDITPPNDIQRPPFIISNVDEKLFELLVINVGDFEYVPD